MRLHSNCINRAHQSYPQKWVQGRIKEVTLVTKPSWYTFGWNVDELVKTLMVKFKNILRFLNNQQETVTFMPSVDYGHLQTDDKLKEKFTIFEQIARGQLHIRYVCMEWPQKHVYSFFYNSQCMENHFPQESPLYTLDTMVTQCFESV